MAARFADRDDVAVFARLGWFPDREDTRIRLDPDVMVESLGISMAAAGIDPAEPPK